jgi:transcriptional regulator of nitric oxide reductase
VDAIDGALRNLYLIRGQLTAEIRQADDATAARTDALLARMREDRER